jgi:hypothetical protein
METIEAKVFRTFIRKHSIFKSDRLSANIRLTLHIAPVMSVMIYACPAWELAADTYLLKLQRLQNKVLRAPMGIFRDTSVRDMQVAFQIPYVYE